MHGRLANVLILTGFINFKRKREWTAIKRVIGDAAHIEPANGDDGQNKTYCTKENDFWEFGTPINQGRRTDLEGVVEKIKAGTEIRKIATDCPVEFIKFHKGIERLHGLIGSGEKRDFKTQVIVYYGETGSGKSRKAAEVAGQSVYYKTRGEWWDGYSQEETVIIDDYYGWIRYDEMLRLCDRYPHQVPVKGGFTNFRSKRIIITSNDPIDKWYNDTWYKIEKIKTLMRRVDVYEFFSIIDNQTIIVPVLYDINNFFIE